MNCDFADKTGPFLDGELSAADRAAYESHALSCAECAAERARLQRISALLHAADAPELRWRGPLVKAQLGKRKLLRFAEMLTAAAALVMLFCGAKLLSSHKSPATNPNAEWAALFAGQSLEAAANSDNEDPLAQALLKEQP